MTAYRQTGQQGLFDYQNRVAELGSQRTILTRLNEVCGWEDYRPCLEAALLKPGTGGRPRWDVVLMFKVLVLAHLFGLSDEQAEAQIADRLSFQQFLGLALADGAPDARTIWRFRDELRRAGVERSLWDTFQATLHQRGIRLSAGKIVDATFVETRRQQQTAEEKQALADGRLPDGWDRKSPAQLRQKDLDARWARKGAASHFGYKNHVKVDAATKLIEDYRVTPANINDNLPSVDLVRKTDGSWYADKAYDCRALHDRLAQLGVDDHILIQARRGHPLTDEQEEHNARHRTFRARGEHPFAMLKVMGAQFTRAIGLARAHWHVALGNLVYNLRRLVVLTSPA